MRVRYAVTVNVHAMCSVILWSKRTVVTNAYKDFILHWHMIYGRKTITHGRNTHHVAARVDPIAESLEILLSLLLLR